MHGKLEAVNRVDGDRVDADPFFPCRAIAHDILIKRRISAEITRIVPKPAPPRIKQQEFRFIRRCAHGVDVAHRDPAAFAGIGTIHNAGPARKLLRREHIQRRCAGKDVRRRIHMRSGMGIHAQERFPEAVLLDRVRRGQPGLLRPRINRHRFADGLCQVNHLHIISPLASC